jgi:hypothetical protein
VLIATALFLTQAAHLIWLGLFVIAERLSGQPIWTPNDLAETWLIIFDYFEIPALIATSLLYISMIRKNEHVRRATLYLIFLNLQYLHIFWITDEFVADSFSGAMHHTILPAWLAWIAILIDYLELPVMYDTAKRSIKILRSKLAPND